MKKFEGVEDLSSDIAYRKQRAGEIRFGRGESSGQKPRDVFVAACTEIANRLSLEGFTFTKSGPSAKRKHTDITDRIFFQSSHNNVAGEYVAVWIHASVHSKRMEKWRAANPFPGSVVHDLIGGGQIGNLRIPTAWLEWNFAVDPNEQATSAVETIRELALPFFQRFQDIHGLSGALAEREILGISVWQGIEFLLCFASREMAERALASFFKRRPDLFAEYLQFVRRYAADGVPDFSGMGYAKDLAKATVVFGITPPAG